MTPAKINRCARKFQAGPRYRRYAGFALLEALIVISIVGGLATIFSERMMRYQEYAEKIAMEVTARRIQAGLRMKVADLMMRDKMQEAGSLLEANPMNWLEPAPLNYAGERRNHQPGENLRGKWYFDTVLRQLVYTPFHRRYFRELQSNGEAVRYQVAALQAATGNRSQRMEGFSLRLLTPYQWDVKLD